LFEHVFGMGHVDLLRVFSVSVIIAHSPSACKACVDRSARLCYIDFTILGKNNLKGVYYEA
jgi:hypothetical protein